MKLALSTALTELVDKHNATSWAGEMTKAAVLHALKEALREATAFKSHLLSATAFNYIQKAEQADTLHEALSCVTAASADLMASHVQDGLITGPTIETASIQHASLATASRPHYPHLCQQIEALPRYDLDSSDCDSCGQDCGADMVAFEDGDYLKREDVLRILGGII